MFYFLLLVALAATASGVPLGRNCIAPDAFVLSDEFEDYLSLFGKHYSSDDEWASHYNAFEESYSLVHDQQQKAKYVLELNRFADMDFQDIKNIYFGIHLPHDGLDVLTHKQASNMSKPPTTKKIVDWTQLGAVTAVKDQGTCGSCWAFSAVAALEGAFQLSSGTLVSLSEQEIVNGTNGMSMNAGCSGGWMFTAFEFVKSAGLATETSVPYTSYYGTGDGPELNLNGAEYGISSGVVTGYTWVTRSANSLMSAVADLPVSVAIEVSSMSFMLYSSGVLELSDCGCSVNHAVTAVGFNMASSDSYWLIKNSWSSDWGDEGYIKLAMDSTQTFDTCCIAGYAFYPTL